MFYRETVPSRALQIIPQLKYTLNYSAVRSIDLLSKAVFFSMFYREMVPSRALQIISQLKDILNYSAVRNID